MSQASREAKQLLTDTPCGTEALGLSILCGVAVFTPGPRAFLGVHCSVYVRLDFIDDTMRSRGGGQQVRLRRADVHRTSEAQMAIRVIIQVVLPCFTYTKSCGARRLPF